MEIEQQLARYYRWCTKTRKLSPNTLIAKKDAINNFLHFSKVTRAEDITTEQIDDWMAYMADNATHNCCARTVNCRVTQLMVMIKYFRDIGISIPKCRLNNIEKQKGEDQPKIWYTEQQIVKVLRYADRREWLQIKLGFDCGLRITELRTLRLGNIRGRMIVVIGKGNKKRHVYMSEEARIRLNDYIRKKHITDYLWPSRNDPRRPISDADIRKMLKQPFEAAGCYDFHPHALRHSFATDLQHKGASIAEIQLALGHSSQVTTEKYMHDLDGADVRKIWNAHKYVSCNLRIR